MDNQRIKENFNETLEDIKSNTKEMANQVKDWVVNTNSELQDRTRVDSALRAEKRARKKEEEAKELHDIARKKITDTW
ncbi:MAG: hypothetical protein LUD68_10495 [Rikenellaceae bacterium]|nr:hypothetical protein [Rikenellaceae bacterium]